MGTTKLKNGDGHIIFHVGKELPVKGESLLLVPGIQKAQGRGVYFSEEPQLKYTGGEHFRANLDVSPIYCVPMIGKWQKGILKKKDNQIVYHTDGRAIALRDLDFVEKKDDQGRVSRYYFPKTISFFTEPQTTIFDEVYSEIRSGRLPFAKAEQYLKEKGSVEEDVAEEKVYEELARARKLGVIPDLLKEDKEIGERMMPRLR